ncbi:MAG: DNA gyrase C-terminal beta-propeller domain-containing protein, partial [Gemmatimonadota bacterium]|nr:DNA gyrase C-terminal beta-propeller domain-containing protein [Gemmatimonadota bacterium]
DEVMLITRTGQIIRSPVSGVRVAGRNTQGVKLMNLEGGDLITAVARVVPEDGEGGEGGEGEGDATGPEELELTSEE